MTPDTRAKLEEALLLAQDNVEKAIRLRNFIELTLTPKRSYGESRERPAAGSDGRAGG